MRGRSAFIAIFFFPAVRRTLTVFKRISSETNLGNKDRFDLGPNL